MPVYRQKKPIHFTLERPVEMHFHDYDETWIIVGGKCMAHMVDRDGTKSDFELEAGDIWLVEPGVEHGCEVIGEEGCDIIPVPGSIPEGTKAAGHLYMDKEHYMPTLHVTKTPIDRYKK